MELSLKAQGRNKHFGVDATLFKHNWRASKASETLSGLFNRESRIYIYNIYIVRANFVLITRKEGGA